MKLRFVAYCCLIVGFLGYSNFIYTSGTELRPEQLPQDFSFPKPEVLKGKKVFFKYNCSSCHQLYGLGGHLGPDLTNVISNPIRGEGYARAIIANGTEIMPRFPLTKEEVDALISYLTFVDATGESPPRSFEINSWGSLRVPRGNIKASHETKE